MVWDEVEQEYISEIRAMLPKISEKFEKLASMDLPKDIMGFFEVWGGLSDALYDLESSEEYIEKERELTPSTLYKNNKGEMKTQTKEQITITVDAEVLNKIKVTLDDSMTPLSKYFNRLMLNDYQVRGE